MPSVATVPTPPAYPTLAALGNAIQSQLLDEFFYIQIDDDQQSCRLRYFNPTLNDNENSAVNERCAALFTYTKPDPGIFNDCVSFNIPMKAKTAGSPI